jgi:hypothetical protein
MRVITPFGFGEASGSSNRLSNQLIAGDEIVVALERKDDPLGADMRLKRSEVFPFGNFLVVRVANVSGVGIASNILPFPNHTDACVFYGSPCPGGETRFFLDLCGGHFLQSQWLCFPPVRYLHLQTWMDRWAREQSAIPNYAEDETDEDREVLCQAFDEWESSMAGTGGGIYAPALLDLEKGEILRFAIAVTATRGVVFSKKFA